MFSFNELNQAVFHENKNLRGSGQKSVAALRSRMSVKSEENDAELEPFVERSGCTRSLSLAALTRARYSRYVTPAVCLSLRLQTLDHSSCSASFCSPHRRRLVISQQVRISSIDVGATFSVSVPFTGH